MGFDLNRHWNDPSPWAHPTLCATKDLVMGYDRDPVSDDSVEIIISNIIVHSYDYHALEDYCLVSNQEVPKG